MGKNFWSRAELSRIVEHIHGELLDGRPEQGIYEQSTVENYLIGSRKVVDDRLFRYSKAAANRAGLARLVINSNICPGATGHEDEDGYEGTLYAAAPVGSKYLDIADTALRAKNYYQGGKVVVYGTTIFHEYHIVASDAGNGTYVRLYLAEPTKVEAMTMAMGVTAYLNPYSAVTPPGGGGVAAGFAAFLGLNLIPVTSGNYFWLQTAGPAIVTPTGGTWPGSAANLRAVYANPVDGTINPATVDDPSAGHQLIGYLLSATVNTYGDLWVMLQLDN